MITSRGVKVFPGGLRETFCTDHWRCRYTSKNGPLVYADIMALMISLSKRSFDIIRTENLRSFDGKPGYSKGQWQ